MWDEITYPFSSFYDPNIEILEWTNSFIRHFAGYVITDPCLD